METIKIELSKNNIPCMWEKGGGSCNTGNSTIITDKKGSPKKPLYIRKKGSLAGMNHALIPATVGDYFIQAYHHRKDFEIIIFKIEDIKEDNAFITEKYKFDNGEWDICPYELLNAVEAAKEKATCYHCREPHYIIQ